MNVHQCRVLFRVQQHTTALLLTNKNSLVSKLRRDKEESSLQNVHRRRNWHRVKVLQLDLSDHVFIVLQLDLEDVALLCLHQEEVHRLGLVSGGADEQHPTVGVVQVVLKCSNTNFIILIPPPSSASTKVLGHKMASRSGVRFTKV